MAYFSYIGYTHSPANRLHEAVLSFLQTQNRQIITDENVETFKKEILDNIEELNKANPRCKPIEAEMCSPLTNGDIYLHMGGIICQFSIYKSKNQ